MQGTSLLKQERVSTAHLHLKKNHAAEKAAYMGFWGPDADVHGMLPPQPLSETEEVFSIKQMERIMKLQE